MKTIVMQKIAGHLNHCEECAERKLSPPSFKDFQRKLIMEHGISKKMIKQLVEVVVPEGTVEDDRIVKKTKG